MSKFFLQNKKERFCAMNFTLLQAKQIDEIPFKSKIINEASASRTFEKKCVITYSIVFKEIASADKRSL